ncbi:MAG: ABC transporter permease [Bauldia sp.]|nr:ABC transporter permease [Bauldia sp.]
MTVARTRRWFVERPWIWSFVIALGLWLTILVVAQGRGGFTVVSAALEFATFYVVVGLGQMLVIAAGPGNIDLSIPGVMTFTAYVAMSIMGGGDVGMLQGLAAGLLVGVATGAVNAFLIRAVAIPPMIATLATGFVLHSMASAYSRLTSAKPSPMLSDLMASRLFGIPWTSVIILVVTLVIGQMLLRTTFGRSILAVGQSPPAAHLSGIRVGPTLVAVYVISGIFASLAGIMLAVFAGGASLEMGSDFILMSIAVVVLGGTAISGGRAVPIGIWGAATLLQLLVTLLNVLGVANGLRHAITGIVIIAVLAIASGRLRS